MSSESVSPASFYTRRGFGYKRFMKVDPKSLDNRIVLYEKYPVFDISDKKLENYPLVIEIDTKSLNEDAVQEQNGSFFADETIYLNPFTTKIYFRDEQEKVSTLSKAEPSIETKMVSLYKNCFSVKPKEIESFDWKTIEIEDSKEDISKHISKDRKINKLKGLLYAYLFAANKSLPAEIVVIKRIAKDFQNFLSAILRSPESMKIELQEKQRDFIEKKLVLFFNDRIVKDKNKDSKTPKEKLPVLQNCKLLHIPEQTEFRTKLFNKYLEEAYNSEDFVQSRYEFAKSGGKVFKDELQEKWEGSNWQQYVNALLKNLNEYSAFDIKSANHLTLESFAAFCQKGESDIDKLEDYLVSNEIGDFRIAFSLWGIVFGFAGMPKTLTNDLFLSDDSDYISEVYKYIYKQVHGIELEGELVAKNKEETITTLSKMNEPITELPIKNEFSSDYDEIMSIINEQEKEKKYNEYKPILQQLAKEAKSKSDFLKKLSNECKITKSTNIYKNIKNTLEYSLASLNRTQEKNIFNDILCLDDDAYILIEGLQDISETQREKLINNLKYVQGQHKEKRDKNSEVIKHFINLCKKDGKYQIPNFSLIMDRIQKILEEKYS
jgi:hypothetical protein